MWILFPNQLFSIDVLKTIPSWKKEHYVLWEDPLFYGIRPDSEAYKGTLKLNQLRIVYQRWLWKTFEASLIKLGLQVTSISYEDIIDSKKSLQLITSWITKAKSQDQAQSVQAFDPEDKVLMNRWKSLPIQWHDSPMFLLSANQLDTYASTHSGVIKGKRLQHSHFYNYVKSEVLSQHFPKITIPASKDTENRKPIPSSWKLPSLPYPSPSSPQSSPPQPLPTLLEEAVLWCNKYFSKNPGPDSIQLAVQSYLQYLPHNPDTAKKWWVDYRKTRFSWFGPYEDAIVSNQPILYHSFSAMLLNFGLLTPKQILEDLFTYYSFKDNSQLDASLEGFIRQIAGWREYSRFYYRYVPSRIYLKNIFHSKNRLSKEWYKPIQGQSSPFPPIVQEAIHDAWNTGYLHHIRRLMVISNYMNLCTIHPTDVYRWMYEFSLDSWEWVMVFNVYSMGTWSDEGHAMRKPYISSPSYLLKMSNTPTGAWVEDWKKKYTTFLTSHSSVLQKTIYAYQLAKINK